MVESHASQSDFSTAAEAALPIDDASFSGLLREAARVSMEERPFRGLELSLGSSIGGGRFQVRRQLGRGGMGTVYEVFDGERREKVALKLLSRLDADHVYRLKNEFRALVDVRHPNLVALHELFAEGSCWYYTMALVRGVRFDRYVRAQGACSIERVRPCLDQLRAAVAAIHAAGKLHRDLKPSNVLVTNEGKVVVLDFGLSVDAQVGGIGQTVTDHAICGTPAYMAPEQAAGRALEPASDLYAIGVMLFESLTGRLPFVGTNGEIMAAKQRDRAPAPSVFARDVPSDLEALCLSLLSPVARERPALPLSRPADADAGRALMGRDLELAVLRAAYADASAGRSVVVRVEGESGIGKTALTEAFLRTLPAEPNLTLLSARCYERESVPFKLFDPLIDALCRSLRRRSECEVARFIPSDVYALTRLFPVLERVPAFVGPAPDVMPSPHELRQRAFDALGALFTRLCARGPLVILVDDLQWSDSDSLHLLAHLLGDRAGFPALLIASHRTERASDRRLSAVFEAARDVGAVDVRTIALGPLGEADTAGLIDALLVDAKLDHGLRAAVVRESGGHPLFAAELAQAVATAPRRASLDELLVARVIELPESARRLLEMVAMSGEPLLARVALAAADAPHEDVARLCDARLVRIGKSHGDHGAGKTLECFHDRVRESAARMLDSAQRRAHARRLADALMALDDVSADLLRRCLIEAGAPGEAARLAREGAAAAEEALAFERAAALWGEVLALSDPTDHALNAQIGERLGRSLRQAGRAGEAARAFRAAAEHATGAEAQRLLRFAASEFVVAGEHQIGMPILARVCANQGVRIPKSAPAALLELTYLSTRLKLRGLALSPVMRPDASLDTLSAAAFGFTHAPLRTAALALRYLINALDAGDALHACLAFGFAATSQVNIRRDGPHVDAFVWHMGRLIVSLSDDPRLDDQLERLDLTRLAGRGFLAYTRAFVLSHRRDLDRAAEAAREAMQWLEQNPGTMILHDLCTLTLLSCAHRCGDFEEIVRLVPPAVHEMLLNGRVLFGAVLTGVGICAWLVPDEPDAARRRLDEARRQWRRNDEPHIADFCLFLGELNLLTYEGRYAEAFALVEGHPNLVRLAAYTDEGPFWPHYIVATTALSLLRTDPGNRCMELQGLIRQCLREIKRLKVIRLDAVRLLEAGLALDAGDRRTAISLLDQPWNNWYSEGLHESCRQFVLGELIGGAEGRAKVEKGRAEMRAQGVKNIDAFLRLSLGFCRPVVV